MEASAEEAGRRGRKKASRGRGRRKVRKKEGQQEQSKNNASDARGALAIPKPGTFALCVISPGTEGWEVGETLDIL